jgi:hypothetical protein
MKGFANRISGKEEFYFSDKRNAVQQLIAEGKPVINLDIGSPNLAGNFRSGTTSSSPMHAN